jgi:hypothetical protein
VPSWIVPVLDGAPWEKMWIGRCCFSGKKPTKQDQRMIAVAGAVVEACSLDRAIWSVADEWDWYDPAVMSESDWCFAGCPVGEPNQALFTAIDKVGALLRPDGGPLWLELIQTARDLIVESRAVEYLADGEMFAEVAA